MKKSLVLKLRNSKDSLAQNRTKGVIYVFHEKICCEVHQNAHQQLRMKKILN